MPAFLLIKKIHVTSTFYFSLPFVHFSLPVLVISSASSSFRPGSFQALKNSLTTTGLINDVIEFEFEYSSRIGTLQPALFLSFFFSFCRFLKSMYVGYLPT